MMKDDIIQEILLRLPVKSLVRCNSLSKEWREFISRNPSFRRSFMDRNRGCSFMLGFHITKHMSLLEEEEQVHFLPTYNRGISVFHKKKGDKDGFALQLDKLPKKRKREECSTPPLLLRKSPCFFSDPAVRVLGSSNGFLLCSLDENCPLNYMIINPINKLCVSLPVASASSEYYSHGFICRSASPQLDTIDYYKVVRGISPNDWNKTSPIRIEIISSYSSRWSVFCLRGPSPFDLDFSNPSRIIISETGLVYVPGDVYNDAASGMSDRAVIMFDESKEESIQLLEFPPTENNWEGRDYFGQSEGLILYARCELGRLKIWRINDQGGGWSLKHDVSLERWFQIYPELFKCPEDLQFYFEAFHPTNKNIIFLGGIEKKILVYDTEKSKVECLCDFKTEGWGLSYYLFPYTCGLIGPHLFLCD